MRKKVWWKSKTILTNLGIGVVTALEIRLDLLQPLLPVNLYSIVSIILVVVNVFLRVTTHSRVGIRAQDDVSRY